MDQHPELNADVAGLGPDKPALEQFAASRDRLISVALKQIQKGNCLDGRVVVRTEYLR